MIQIANRNRKLYNFSTESHQGTDSTTPAIQHERLPVTGHDPYDNVALNIHTAQIGQKCSSQPFFDRTSMASVI